MSAYTIFSQVSAIFAVFGAGALFSASLRLVTFRDPVRPVEVQRMFKRYAGSLRLLGMAAAACAAFICWAGTMTLIHNHGPNLLFPILLGIAMLAQGFALERRVQSPIKRAKAVPAAKPKAVS